MTSLAFTKTGDGPPLVLLHGIGGSRAAWRPVLDRLAATHTVYAVDLPGHGDSPGPGGAPRHLAQAVSAALDERGIDVPHVAGNSLGGWVAVELAALRPVASLTLLSPAGFWQRAQPAYCTVVLLGIRLGCRFAGRPLAALCRWAWGRRLVFRQVCARPELLSPDDARRSITAMGRCPGFRDTFRAVRPLRCEPAAGLTVPVTVAFGDADRILLARQSRFTGGLPAHTRHLPLPGAGHVPMSDDPGLIARTVLVTTGAVAR
ncbi:alpha/beta fold hydrolase [Actinoplanes sp. NPDC024001]|uniref:alpha/beta fold hydrolase n=1 Tax=Actinoplanes sp. NPDC024001 TaxID=3154598 RepID=UPI00340891AF